jgi:hypothetical protein
VHSASLRRVHGWDGGPNTYTSPSLISHASVVPQLCPARQPGRHAAMAVEQTYPVRHGLGAKHDAAQYNVPSTKVTHVEPAWQLNPPEHD